MCVPSKPFGYLEAFTLIHISIVLPPTDKVEFIYINIKIRNF